MPTFNNTWHSIQSDMGLGPSDSMDHILDASAEMLQAACGWLDPVNHLTYCYGNILPDVPPDAFPQIYHLKPSDVGIRPFSWGDQLAAHPGGLAIFTTRIPLFVAFGVREEDTENLQASDVGWMEALYRAFARHGSLGGRCKGVQFRGGSWQVFPYADTDLVGYMNQVVITTNYLVGGEGP